MNTRNMKRELRTVLHVQSKTIGSGAAIAAKTISQAVQDYKGFESSIISIERRPSQFEVFWSAIRYRIERRLLGWGLSETITPISFSPEVEQWRASVLHLHNIYDSGLRIEEISRLTMRFPLVWTIHDGRWIRWVHSHKEGTKNLLKKFGGRILRSRLRKAGKHSEIVYPSEWLRQEAIRNKIFEGKNQNVIPTPVALEFFQAGRSRDAIRKRHEFSVSVPLVLFVAWKAWKTGGDINKGYDLLEEAIPKLRLLHHFQFAILGHDGNKIPGSLGAKWICPDGTLSQVADLMKAADFVVGASKQEGLGNVIQEAHAVGTPALVSRSTGYLEIVDDGITGLHFDTGDAADFASKASKLLASPGETQVMGANAAKKALMLWHPTIIAGQYQQVYDKAYERWKKLGPEAKPDQTRFRNGSAKRRTWS